MKLRRTTRSLYELTEEAASLEKAVEQALADTNGFYSECYLQDSEPDDVEVLDVIPCEEDSGD